MASGSFTRAGVPARPAVPIEPPVPPAAAVKLVTVGASGVGKSCLLIRFAKNIFSGTFITTVGVDYHAKTVETPHGRLRLTVWDTAGQERFHSLSASYVRGAAGCLVVVDADADEERWAQTARWLDDVRAQSIPLYLVVNKVDAAPAARVAAARSRAEALLRAKGLLAAASPGGQRPRVFETSAKRGTGVDELFAAVADEQHALLLHQAHAGTGGGGGAPGRLAAAPSAGVVKLGVAAPSSSSSVRRCC